MKKIIFVLLPLLAMLFTACEPISEDNGPQAQSLTSEGLVGLISYTQTDKDGNEQADGNYFHYTATRVVQFYLIKSDGEESVLSTGTKGDFTIAPSRGSSPNQTVYVRTMNTDGTKIEGSFNVTVYVATEMSKELKMLVSDSGKKVWTWNPDPAHDNRVWGNGCYKGSSGLEFVNSTNGVWWGCTAEELTEQLQHSNTGVATGEEDLNAYMEFTEDGKIVSYDANGNVIRQGTFEITDYDESRSDGWKIGTLKTSQGAILFPFKINGGGEMPTEFDIMQLTAGEILLVYGGNGDGQECTFWRFKSTSDVEGLLTGYGSKTWKWGSNSSGSCWGNCSFSGYNGDDQWWGVNAADVAGQITDTGYSLDDSGDATMTFTYDGKTLTKSSGGKGTFSIEANTTADGNIGTLTTTGDGILFPVNINSSGTVVNTFEIVSISSNKLVLSVKSPNYEAFGEGTYWIFEAE